MAERLLKMNVSSVRFASLLARVSYAQAIQLYWQIVNCHRATTLCTAASSANHNLCATNHSPTAHDDHPNSHVSSESFCEPLLFISALAHWLHGRSNQPGRSWKKCKTKNSHTKDDDHRLTKSGKHLSCPLFHCSFPRPTPHPRFMWMVRPNMHMPSPTRLAHNPNGMDFTMCVCT